MVMKIIRLLKHICRGQMWNFITFHQQISFFWNGTLLSIYQRYLSLLDAGQEYNLSVNAFLGKNWNFSRDWSEYSSKFWVHFICLDHLKLDWHLNTSKPIVVSICYLHFPRSSRKRMITTNKYIIKKLFPSASITTSRCTLQCGVRLSHEGSVYSYLLPKTSTTNPIDRI